MAIRVLVVDDSNFFRRRVTEILNDSDQLEVVGTAADGEEAIKQARALRPDVITMDIEMPVLDGISAVRKIMAERPTPILMFSSLSHEGAQATLDALDAGAVDFLPKKFEDIARNRGDAVKVLQSRVAEIGRKGMGRTPRSSFSTPSPSTPSARPSERPTTRPFDRSARTTQVSRPAATEARPSTSAAPAVARSTPFKLVAIGTSTGGPVALQTVLTALPATFPVPIVLVQHMPAAFTKAFAERLNGLCKISVKEAQDGDVLKPGHAYLAPGGKQMLVEGRSGSGKLRIRADDSDKLTYRPSVDLTFASISKSYGGDVLGIILTGMGADGREGCRMLKQQGSTIWAQDKDTCVVYGMPQAVAAAGISERDIPIQDVANHIIKAFEKS
ncbi:MULTISPECIES: chemotaxis response regulator protein-glutamate methylesterase [Gammaproteobacteria]|uniref:protein-glutamate methylesterase/protein-glutamine glutaminase n=1 Tax=Gammaproteobacteria TaxID=1236 RepID=UPI000DD08E4B|nr:MULTISPECIES: chemotaxis response regulator protein-glutamate methylesterase [Gammaproteobacteria]RTE86124.1 chemotaxis response regulator protein-glutamate methylesterase [Aliidiomarina sp. B3213]TCZ91477.1 chemotaxis response regulator protein-glutamate methylesterase [Lysobacter sp. N42]